MATTVKGVRMMGDDKKPFLVVQVSAFLLRDADSSAKCMRFYVKKMGDRIVLAAETRPRRWRTFGPTELLAQFDGDQIGLAEWEDFPLSADWATHT